MYENHDAIGNLGNAGDWSSLESGAALGTSTTAGSARPE